MSLDKKKDVNIVVESEKVEAAEEWIDGSCSDKSADISETIHTGPGASLQDDVIGFASKNFLNNESTQKVVSVEESSFTTEHGMNSPTPHNNTGPMPFSMINNQDMSYSSASSQHQHQVSYSAISASSTNVCIRCHCETCVCGSGGAFGQTGLPIVPSSGQVVDCCDIALNKDATPEVIVKHPDKPIKYQQDIGVRYLKPPTPPPSGNIVIREVRPPPVPEAPPLYVRLKPERPKTPPPLIIREAPPKPFKRQPTVVIDKVLPPAPPPPRKVIVEKLPPLPPKPQKVIIEKWLPYEKIKRNIIYQKLPDLPPTKNVKNTLITWSPIKAQIFKKFQNLGIIKADPSTYANQFCSELKDSNTTMNAMINMGASLHYQEAARAENSGQDVYYEDKEELARLMHTNFHPNDPICKQYLEKHGNLFAQNQVGMCTDQLLSSSELQRRNLCSEAQLMASGPCQNIQQMHQMDMGPPSFSPCADISWVNSAYGQVVNSTMGGVMCDTNVSSMYPQFCQGSQFVPLCPGPTNVCPFASDSDHCFERCTMCQQISFFPP
ncbi:hypothetical protein GJ496_010240 [Pomphorhynchus laevis]|nr:hypothetical protein GJ496_010240 [Pomphorhynchus laevis]